MPPDDPFVSTLQKGMQVIMRRSMQDFFRFAKEKDLSMSQIGALFHMYRGSSDVSGLGDRLGVTRAAASQMLDRLVQMKWITRTEDPDDRRVKKIVLTEKGRCLLEETIQARNGWLAVLSQKLSSEEKEQITAAFSILIDKANQIDN
jgi:DNA-binding MarR family transcriptional regulator